MPAKYEGVSVDRIKSTAEDLGKCARMLTECLNELNQEGVAEIWLMWTEKTDRNIDQIVGLGRHALAELDEAVRSHRDGRPNRHSLTRSRSKRDYEVRSSKTEPSPAIKKGSKKPQQKGRKHAG